MSDVLVFTRRSGTEGTAIHSLTLAFEQRQKSRLHVKLDSGREVFLKLERGPVLRGGDILQTDTGESAKVIAAAEALSVVRSESPLALTRAAYHLGNRHVALQIREGELSYLQDKVLDAMVLSMRFEVNHETGPFEPEAGAYGHGGVRAGTPGHGLYLHAPHSHY